MICKPPEKRYSTSRNTQIVWSHKVANEVKIRCKTAKKMFEITWKAHNLLDMQTKNISCLDNMIKKIC